MTHKVLLLFLISMPVFAGPIIDCRFEAINTVRDNDIVKFIKFDILPDSDREKTFTPYKAVISSDFSTLKIKVFLSDALISQLRIPLDNVAFLPLNVPIFGQVRVPHTETDSFTSIRYECIKLL